MIECFHRIVLLPLTYMLRSSTHMCYIVASHAVLFVCVLFQVLEQFGQEDPDTEGAEKEGDKDKEDRDREGELESKGEGDGVAVDAALDSSRSSPASEKLTDRMARRKITRIENK